MGLLLCAAAVKAAEERAKAVATATEKLQQSEVALKELDAALRKSGLKRSPRLYQFL